MTVPGALREGAVAVFVALLVIASVAAPAIAFSAPSVGDQSAARNGGDGTIHPGDGTVSPTIHPGDATVNPTTSDRSGDSAVSANVRELVSAARAGDTDGRFVSGADDDARVTVTVVAAPGRADEVASAVGRHGRVTSRFGGSIGASLTPTGVGALADAPGVETIRRPAPAVVTDQGSVVSEGLPNVNVSDRLHGSGITGSNVTVAVVDTGFNADNPEIADHVAGFRNFEGDGDPADRLDNETGLHGTAVAELVADTAPNASLLLYEVASETGVGAAIEHVTENTSADVASMSLGLLTGPFDGTSAIDGAIEDSVDNGTSWYVSAGNYADGQHYNGTWQDGDGDGWMNVSSTAESIDVSADGGFEIYVNWADENARYEDYDVYLNQSGTVVDRSTIRQDGDREPVEVVENASGGEYTLRIKNEDANGTADFDVFVNGQGTLTPSTSARSVARPATEETAVAVGAVYYGDDGLEGFSSRGPTVDGRTKPDLVAPDGVQTSQPGSSGLNPFFGTSAAAPHAAGVAALVIDSTNRSIGPAKLERVLTESATRLDDAVPNNRTGYGLVNATGAIEAATESGSDESTGTTASLALAGGSIAPATVEESTTVSHDIGATFENVSRDGETDAFWIRFPDAVGWPALSLVDASASNRTSGAAIAVANATTVDGPDGDGIQETVRVTVSPTGGGTVDAVVNASVTVTWPVVDADTDYPVSVAGQDSATGSVPLTDIARATVAANAPPTASIAVDPTEPTIGATATFDAAGSSDSDGGIERYEWTVGGEAVGTGETLSHVFDSAGDHEVGLAVTDDDGASDTATTTVTVNAPPTASIAVSSAAPTVGKAVTLSATGSSDGDGSIRRYEWTIEGEAVGTGETLSHVFDVAGDHEIGVTVTDDDGATATATETVDANARPRAEIRIGTNEPEAGRPVAFNASGSVDPDGAIEVYEWDLDGDGQYDDATGVEITTTFESPGERSVGLRVIDDVGATNVTAVAVTIAAAATDTEGATVTPDATDTTGAEGTTPAAGATDTTVAPGTTDTRGTTITADATGTADTATTTRATITRATTDSPGQSGFDLAVTLLAGFALVLLARYRP